MNFSALAIKRPIPVIILFSLLTILGLIAFNRIAINDYPDMEYPAVTVNITLPGATSAQVETEITGKVEDSLSNVSGIKHITSHINAGNSNTFIEFDLEQNLDEALLDVKDALEKTRAELPKGIEEPQINKVKVSSNQAILTYQIQSSQDQLDLSWFVDNDINRLLFSVPGVAKVSRQGGANREIEVLIDPFKLASLKLTIVEVVNKFKDILGVDTPAGQTPLNNNLPQIQAQTNIVSLSDLTKLNLPLAESKNIHLNALATVSDTNAAIKQLAFYNGQSIISFAVFAAKNANSIAVAELVRAKIKLFESTHPNYKIREIDNSSGAINDSYHASLQALYEGCILAIIVVWLFLADWRATLISATALPLAIIPTFLCIYSLGFSLNGISLLALSLVTGVLVDDAIVEVENIMRHLVAKKSTAREASLAATAEIGRAVIATSLCLVAVFLPTAFMSGVTGRFFRQFGYTAAIAVVSSLVVARLVTPILAAYFMQVPQVTKPRLSKLTLKYLGLVSWCLNHHWKMLIASLVFFSCSLLLILFLPSTFFPIRDDNQITFNLQFSQNSSVATVSKIMQQAYSLTQAIPGVANIYAAIGDADTANQVNNGSLGAGTLTYFLQKRNLRAHSQAELEQIIAKRLITIPGAKFSAWGAHSSEQYSLILTSQDPDLLKKTVGQVEHEIHGLAGVGNINSDFDATKSLVVVKTNNNQAARLGITSYDIGTLIHLASVGDYTNNLAKINLGARQIPVRLKLALPNSQSIAELKELQINGASGLVALGSVAAISLGSEPAEITRTNRERSVKLKIGISGRNVGDVDQQINTLPIMRNLPAGVSKIASGDLEQMHSMFSSFILAIISGIIAVYGLLVILFNDFKQPLTILAALPLAAGGALASLAVCGFSISLPALIGVLMLMGIVSKNSILLVDYALIAINQQGQGLPEAILQSCQKRARPIIMTTVAMIAGMLPLALGFSSNASFNQPMAVTVIGGLISSTLLSLLVVPVIFERLARLKFAQ